MVPYLVVAIVGFAVGWQGHKAYLRTLVKTIRKLKRKLVGR